MIDFYLKYKIKIIIAICILGACVMSFLRNSRVLSLIFASIITFLILFLIICKIAYDKRCERESKELVHLSFEEIKRKKDK